MLFFGGFAAKKEHEESFWGGEAAPNPTSKDFASALFTPVLLLSVHGYATMIEE